jgi:hypothetical protein
MKNRRWENIPEFDGFYKIDRNGNIKSIKRTGQWVENKILSPAISKDGYHFVCLNKNGVSKREAVHRLVAKTFLPNTRKAPEVNHKNGIKTDNRVGNLEWVTRSENKFHAYKHGLRKPIVGSKHGMSKLKDVDILDIRTSRDSAKSLATKFDINVSTVYSIIRGRYWRHSYLPKSNIHY